MLVTNDSLLSLSLVLAVQTVKRKCQKLESETSLKRSSRRCCFLRSICLTATLRPVLRSTAVQTIPVDPSPIFTKLSKARRGSPRLTTDSIALRNCNKMQQLSQTSALEVIQRIRGYFYNDMHYINLCFTYLPTYLLTYRSALQSRKWQQISTSQCYCSTLCSQPCCRCQTNSTASPHTISQIRHTYLLVHNGKESKLSPHGSIKFIVGRQFLSEV